MVKISYIEKLKELGLLSDFEENKLTILRLSYYLKISFSKLERKLYKEGFPKVITYNTIVNSEWLPVILQSRSHKNNLKIKKIKNSKTAKTGKLKKKVPIRNWLNKKIGIKYPIKEEEENKDKEQRLTIISIPMGGGGKIKINV